MVFLTLDEVILMHSVLLAQHGGLSGIRDQGALESAVFRAQASFCGEWAYTYPFGMAAA